MKTCTKCGGSGPFNKQKQSKDGLNPRCAACMRKYFRAWKAANPNKPKEYARKNYAQNIEKARASRRAYYNQNKERMNARVRNNYHADPEKRLSKIQAWKEANPNKVKSVSARRRAWIVKASGNASSEHIAARVELFGGMCAYCGVRPYEHIDHVIPLVLGGSNWPANLRPACGPCNLSKNKQVWILPNFGHEVGGDQVPYPYEREHRRPIVKRHNEKPDPSFAMEHTEIWYRDYRDAIGGYTQLERFLLLAKKYKRTAVLRPQQLCMECYSVLVVRNGYSYCPNLCEEYAAVVG